jgi:2-methylisocitrate lyase-like PEP mutase family enzyme
VSNSRGAELRELLAGDPFIAADCYSALTARIVEHVGFPAAYMGGHATGMMHYAIPDNGALTPTEMIEQAARVADAVDIPIIADADQAGETVADVYRSIRRYDRAGVAAVHIEDEIPPKHSAGFDNSLLPIADMQARIAAAVDGRTSDDFVIFVRCDEMYKVGGGGTGSLEQCIERGIAYAEAGADVYIPDHATPEQLPQIAAEVKIPVACYGPLQPGTQVSLFTGFGTNAAAQAHYEIATHVLAHGTYPPDMPRMPEKDTLIRQDLYDAVVRKWAERTGRRVRPPA